MHLIKNYSYILLGILLFSLPLSTKAAAPSTLLEAYSHLYEVNKEWQYYPQAAPETKLHFANDKQRIRLHLELVINHLYENIPTGISSQALQNRRDLLGELKVYAQQEIFPINLYHHHNRQPYFIDHRDVHCAVGYLMKMSGAGALAKQISTEQNYDYIEDIKTPRVAEWAKEKGFLLKELAWIQPAYSANEIIQQVGGGTNGPIAVLEKELQTPTLPLTKIRVLENQICKALKFLVAGQ